MNAEQINELAKTIREQTGLAVRISPAEGGEQ